GAATPTGPRTGCPGGGAATPGLNTRSCGPRRNAASASPGGTSVTAASRSRPSRTSSSTSALTLAPPLIAAPRRAGDANRRRARGGGGFPDVPGKPLALLLRLGFAKLKVRCEPAPEGDRAMRGDLERDPVGVELERLCAERGNWLMATAIALTGDRADAEDLLQTALERLLRHRRGISGTEAYLRRTLYNLAADGWRRRGAWQRKIPILRAEHLRGGAGAAAPRTGTVGPRGGVGGLLRP